jgi:hypothetical protein
MSTTAPADLQRWSEELARNPASLAFLPLARAYRRQGRVDHALRLCLRGLEEHPTHVEGHALLALLYLESGDRARAADEWATVLRLKPGNFEALRGMGFRYLEQGEIGKARQHLERAALIRPTDTAVQEALRLLRGREDEPMRIAETKSAGAAGAAIAAPAAGAGGGSPFALVEPEVVKAGASPVTVVLDQAPVTRSAALAAEATPDVPAAETIGAPAAAAVAVEAQAGLDVEDPTRLFDALLRGGPVAGALLLDRHGQVLAGRLTGEAAQRGEDVGALLGGTAEEVARTVAHLELRGWRGMLLECGDAILHLAPIGDGELIVLALKRDAPRGWVLRAATHAALLADPFLRGSP